MVCARELKKEKYKVVSVIGDGSLTGGLAFEALNNAASLKSNYIMILNDNHMSISENVGGLSHYLAGVRTAKGYTNFKKNVKASLSKMNADVYKRQAPCNSRYAFKKEWEWLENNEIIQCSI